MQMIETNPIGFVRRSNMRTCPLCREEHEGSDFMACYRLLRRKILAGRRDELLKGEPAY